LSIIQHVTLQKIVAHDFRYDPRRFLTAIAEALTCVINSYIRTTFN
jgi:hypothetical protein